jgi:serine phosphatase RsbU (regulator of sigma subunit)
MVPLKTVRTNCAMCLATLSANDRTLRYANAGIPYPVVKSGQKVFELEANGMPLGGFREAEYQEVSLQLKSGDVLVFFSDGITDAPQKTNRISFIWKPTVSFPSSDDLMQR